MAHTPPGQTRAKVLAFVRERLLAGNPPSVREVQEAMGFAAVESARKQLDILVAEGRLAKAPGRARGYRLPARRGAPRAVLVPLLGRVRAGNLQAAIEAPEGHIAVESRLAATELFALQVEGDSMVGAAILPGDVVVVHRQPDADNGQVVVALVGDEATVKTLRRRGKRIELHAENPRYQPIVPEAEDFYILGRVVEVRRRLT